MFSTISKALNLTRLRHERLSPVDENQARPNTLSSRYGFGEFPLHTDRCLDDPPPRYILLLSPSPRPTPTILWDTRRIPQETRSQAVFAIGDQGRKRYVRFEETMGGSPVVRYNPAICEPRTTAALAVVKEVAAMTCCLDIDWTEHVGVVIDNWRMLHGRRELAGGNPRYLRRITGWTTP
jgi:hypothetical protein